MQAKHNYILTVTQANNTILKRFITRFCIPYIPFLPFYPRCTFITPHCITPHCISPSLYLY